MKTLTQKALTIIALFVTFNQAYALAPYALYEKSNQITQNLYYYENQLANPQAEEINRALDRIDLVYHLSPAQCGEPADVYENAYDWAYSASGLNYFSSDAKKFAKKVSKKVCPAYYLASYKENFNYAYSYSGLNKYKSDAISFANIISNYEQSLYYPKSTLSCFKMQYDYAYSSGGLYKSSREAEEFAMLQCLAPKPYSTLSVNTKK